MRMPFKRPKWDRPPEYAFEINDYRVIPDPTDPVHRVIVQLKTDGNELVNLHFTNGDLMQLLSKGAEAIRVDIGLRIGPGSMFWRGMNG